LGSGYRILLMGFLHLGGFDDSSHSLRLEGVLMSKGSKPRPIPEPDKFRDNWDKIFGKKKDDKSS